MRAMIEGEEMKEMAMAEIIKKARNSPSLSG